MCFATLSSVFTHNWTNLLSTQCQYLSADVCELQVYTHIYSAQKIPTKIYKKQHSIRLQRPKGQPNGGHPPPGWPGGATPPMAEPGGRLGGGPTSGAPLWPIFTSRRENP